MRGSSNTPNAGTARAFVKVWCYRERITLFFESIRNKYKKYVISTGVVSLVTAGMTTPAHAQQTDEIVEFDIPAQKLSNALKSYGVAADRQVLFAVNLVRGKQANAVSGELQPDAALEQLLIGSGLAYETTVSDVVVIKAAQQDTSGGQTFRVASVDDDDTSSVTMSEDEGDVLQELEEIIVTGTNIRGVNNPTTPVLTFDRHDIELSGAITVEEFLRTIPQNFNSTTPLIDGDNDFAGDNGLDGTSVDLRGLGVGSTLTLLNGRRMSVSGAGSAVDVSVLPLGAIERVEVQTDGASAMYGSDAVGGVVNFITRKDFEGFEVGGHYGRVTKGSKEDLGIGAAGGQSWSSGGFMMGVEYVDTRPLLTSERDFIDANLIANSQGTIGVESDRSSAIASFHQSMSDRMSVAINGLYSDRESERTQNFGDFSFLSTQETYFLNAELELEVSDSITASLFYDYGSEDGSSFRSSPALGDSIVGYKNRLELLEGTIGGHLRQLKSGGDLSFAVGGVYREEEFDQSTGLFLSSPKRDVFALYGEMLLPLVGENNALPHVRKFDVSIAARYEDYSDFGDTTNPKIGVRWATSDELSLMASYSESFRAPKLLEIFTQEIAVVRTFPNSFITAFPPPPQSDLVPPGQTIVLLTGVGGNPNLSEETADVWSAGVTYAPDRLKGLTLSATYFNIGYDDRAEQVSFLDILRAPEYLVLVDVPPYLRTVEDVFNQGESEELLFFNLIEDAGPEDVQVIVRSGFQNVASRDVEGFDFTIDYEFDSQLGQFAASLNASHISEFETQLTDLSPRVDQVDILYRPLDLRARGSLSWSRNNITAFAAVNYSSAYRDSIDETTANNVDSWTTLDLNFSYDTSGLSENALLSRARISLSLQNVLDEDPPFVLTSDGFNYDTSNADPFGRYVSLSLSMSL